jgi:hypothetical protein
LNKLGLSRIGLVAWVGASSACGGLASDANGSVDGNAGGGGSSGIMRTGSSSDSGGSTSVSSVCARSGPPTLISTSPQTARDVASDGERVYWSTWGIGASQNDGMIVSAPARGGAASVLAKGEGTTMQVAVDASAVYWLNYGENLRRLAKGSAAAPTTLAAPTEPGPMAYAIDTTRAYYTTTGGIWSVPLAGGDAVKLADAPGDVSIALDEAYVYWVERTEALLLRVSKTGGIVEVVASGTTAFSSTYSLSLAVDGSRAYWTSTGAGAVFAVAKGGGGSPERLLGGLQCPSTIRLDEESLFFADDSIACPSDPADHPQRAIDLVSTSGGPLSVAGNAQGGLDGAFGIDANNLYWANRDTSSGDSAIWCYAR